MYTYPKEEEVANTNGLMGENCTPVRGPKASSLSLYAFLVVEVVVVRTGVGSQVRRACDSRRCFKWIVPVMVMMMMHMGSEDGEKEVMKRSGCRGYE